MNNYGGFWLRVVAYIIDAIVLALIGAAIALVFGFGPIPTNPDLTDPGSGMSMTDNLVGIVIALLYFSLLESSAWQATIGKKALGLIVTDTAGARISLARALGRYLAKFVSAAILLIGFVMVAFTERKQGLHDLIASTLVIKGEPGTGGADTAVFD
ncbi:RDD family protein [Qipengyuania nanhaisediminis]|uniref:RDD family protein n=1 Tax=Qipengyuania nanhaisediminis TaxID=604088 RepID=UPI0038B2ACD6